MSGLFETLSGAKGIRAAGASEKNIAEFNAQVAKQQAKAERIKAGFAQKRQAKKGAEIKSALVAKLGAAGGIGAPVAADLAAEQAAELELENLLIGFEGEIAARRAESQAVLDRLRGKLAKQRGKAGARAANIQFGLQLATLGLATRKAPSPFLTGLGTPASTLPGTQSSVRLGISPRR